jgi:hypothetical protein
MTEERDFERAAKDAATRTADGAISDLRAARAERDEAVGLLRRRHGMECPTYDDNSGTCQGCEVSELLARLPPAEPGSGPTCPLVGCAIPGKHDHHAEGPYSTDKTIPPVNTVKEGM